VARLVSRSDAAVLASAPTRSGKREGIPVALMEAMSAGLPVVASRTGGIPELVNHDHNGFLVPPADPVALADALERLALDAPLRERMGRAGRETIIREFNQEQCAADLVGLIQRCGGLAGAAAVTLSATRSSESVTLRPDVCHTRPSITMIDPAGASNGTMRAIGSAGTSAAVR
jgi:hypothetical protein